MINEIKSKLNLYNELVEIFVKKNTLSSEQREFIFKSLGPPLDHKIVDEFENLNNIKLPVEYKLFLTEVGNGTGSTWDDAGIGPELGILKVTFNNRQCFIFDDNEIDLTKPFQFTEEYNLDNRYYLSKEFTVWLDKYTNKFRNELFQLREPTNEEFKDFIKKNGENPQDKYYENFELNGVLPICGIGCGEYYFIVITGHSKGEIWIDYRDSWGGVSPALDKNGSRYKFDTWYNEYLTEAIEKLKKKL